MATALFPTSPIKRGALITSLASIVAIAATGTAQAGSCSNNKAFDGPASKVEIVVKNRSDTAIDVEVGRADHTSDIKAQSDNYNVLRSTTIEPGATIDVKKSQAPNGQKAYSVTVLDTLNIFRVNNKAELTTGTTKYKAEGSNLEYREYNQDRAGMFKITCDRKFSGTKGWWIVTFKVENRTP